MTDDKRKALLERIRKVQGYYIKHAGGEWTEMQAVLHDAACEIAALATDRRDALKLMDDAIIKNKRLGEAREAAERKVERVRKIRDTPARSFTYFGDPRGMAGYTHCRDQIRRALEDESDG